MDEDNKYTEEKKKNEGNESPKKDFLLSASILVAAILISVSVIYSTGKKSLQNDTSAGVSNKQEVNFAELINKVPGIAKEDKILGNINAPVKIIEYSDLECPFCKKFHYTLKNIKSIYGDQVVIVYRHFPLSSLHSKAIKEAQATECVYKLGGNSVFWEYVDKIFEVTPSNDGLDLSLLPEMAGQVGIKKESFESCLKDDYGADIVKKQFEEAVNAGAQGTPFSVVIGKGDKRYPVLGAYPLDEVKKIVDAALKD